MWILFVMLITADGRSESRWQGYEHLSQCETAKENTRPVLTDGTPAAAWSMGCQPLSRN